MTAAGAPTPYRQRRRGGARAGRGAHRQAHRPPVGTGGGGGGGGCTRSERRRPHRRRGAIDGGRSGCRRDNAPRAVGARVAGVSAASRRLGGGLRDGPGRRVPLVDAARQRGLHGGRPAGGHLGPPPPCRRCRLRRVGGGGDARPRNDAAVGLARQRRVGWGPAMCRPTRHCRRHWRRRLDGRGAAALSETPVSPVVASAVVRRQWQSRPPARV